MQNVAQFQERTLALLNDLSEAKKHRRNYAAGGIGDSEKLGRFGAVKWSGMEKAANGKQSSQGAGFLGHSLGLAFYQNGGQSQRELMQRTGSAQPQTRSSAGGGGGGDGGRQQKTVGENPSVTHWLSDSVKVRNNFCAGSDGRSEEQYRSIVPTKGLISARPKSAKQVRPKTFHANIPNASRAPHQPLLRPSQQQQLQHQQSQELQTSKSQNATGTHPAKQILAAKLHRPILPQTGTESIRMKKIEHRAGANDEEKEREKEKDTKNSEDVVFSESNGILVVFRTAKAKLKYPDRLNLDRRDLRSIPLIEKEEKLRLLNFQRNQITWISNLQGFTELVYLDLSNNLLSEICNLERLVGLRVLMLGENKIEKIENLENLRQLDVLDLHSNRVQELSGLESLQSLRVLNLAANKIRCVELPCSLSSLTEINLRRNFIDEVKDLHNGAPALRHLFLSNNKLSNEESIEGIWGCGKLTELALDGNKLLLDLLGENYRSRLVMKLVTLAVLDLVPITVTERKRAEESVRKELLENPSGETPEFCAIDKIGEDSGSGAESQPQTNLHQSKSAPISTQQDKQPRDSVKNGGCPLQKWFEVRRIYSQRDLLSNAETKWVESTLADMEHRDVSRKKRDYEIFNDGEGGEANTLQINGDDFSVLDSSKVIGAVERIQFHGSSLEPLIVNGFSKLFGLSKITNVTLSRVKVDSLADLALLAKALPPQVVALRFKFAPITHLQFYRPWLVHHLSNVMILDGVLISQSEKVAAASLFGPLLNNRENIGLEHSLTTSETQLRKKKKMISTTTSSAVAISHLLVGAKAKVKDEVVFQSNFKDLVSENVERAKAEQGESADYWRKVLNQLGSK